MEQAFKQAKFTTSKSSELVFECAKLQPEYAAMHKYANTNFFQRFAYFLNPTLSFSQQYSKSYNERNIIRVSQSPGLFDVLYESMQTCFENLNADSLFWLIAHISDALSIFRYLLDAVFYFLFDIIFVLFSYSHGERLPFFHQVINDTVCTSNGERAADCDFHVLNNVDNRENRNLFGIFDLQDRPGYDMPVDVNNFCVIQHDKTCVHPDFDCPPPMNEDHVYIHNAFNDYINENIRNKNFSTESNAIKSIKFGTDSGVTLLNPAVYVQKCSEEDVNCKSYSAFKKFVIGAEVPFQEICRMFFGQKIDV